MKDVIIACDFKDKKTTLDFLDQFTGEMDLEGSWQDETSGRAQMEISMNEIEALDGFVRFE